MHKQYRRYFKYPPWCDKELCDDFVKTHCTQGEMAERSKALESGSSPKGRGFESHSRQTFCVVRWPLVTQLGDKIRAKYSSSRYHYHQHTMSGMDIDKPYKIVPIAELEGSFWCF
jgi:hypothetical protein